jgi:SAM-dependent methyltransferase
LPAVDSPRVAPFVRHSQRYDDWFERHGAAYLSELLAVRALLPCAGRGLEIGVGSGRFAAPLGVEFGIDPAAEMLAYASSRGVRVARAVGEALPFAQAAFDYALAVTTLCFVEDPRVMLAEARRVLKPGGALVIGFIDCASVLGRCYEAQRGENVFYRDARFRSGDEVEGLLGEAGFVAREWVQTLCTPVEALRDTEPLRAGRGEGGFAVVKAVRP